MLAYVTLSGAGCQVLILFHNSNFWFAMERLVWIQQDISFIRLNDNQNRCTGFWTHGHVFQNLVPHWCVSQRVALKS
jgi:hypothetical protein